MAEDGNGPSLRLPRFTAEVDCGPIGYPGLTVKFWINVTYDAARIADIVWEKQAKRTAEDTGQEPAERPKWDTDYYYNLGRIVEEVHIPAEFTADEQALTIPVRDGRDLHELMCRQGFEQMIILWASQGYYELKQKRLAEESKN